MRRARENRNGWTSTTRCMHQSFIYCNVLHFSLNNEWRNNRKACIGDRTAKCASVSASVSVSVAVRQSEISIRLANVSRERARGKKGTKVMR